MIAEIGEALLGMLLKTLFLLPGSLVVAYMLWED